MRLWLGWLASLVFLLVSLPGSAASTGRLPGWVCGLADPSVFLDGMEDCGICLYAEPSAGSGGAGPGSHSASVVVNGVPRSYYLHIPSGYPFSDPAPLLLVLHGAGGSGTAPAAAQYLRDAWAATADTAGFIVVAPIGSHQQSGSWVPTNDYPMFLAVLNDVAAHYNIDRSRIHGWGYSAGGHVMHDLALHNRGANPVPDIRTFAAYGISAGVLTSLVCDGPGQPGCADFLPQVPRKIPVSLRVGDYDYYQSQIQWERLQFIIAGWVPGNTLEHVVFSGGHIIDPAQFLPTWQFFCPFQRLPD